MLKFAITGLFLIACCHGQILEHRSLEKRVMGGRDADISEVPYQVSLEYHGNHICGGAIISTNWVVTASHCFDEVYQENLRFRAGSSTRRIGGSLHEAIKIIKHPNYNFNNIDFDIAVVQVSPPFIMSSDVQPISLSSFEPAAGTAAIVSGWGVTGPNSGSLPGQLQLVVMPIIDHEDCNRAHAIDGGITENMICAGLPTVGKAACPGDSGGPLVTEGKLSGIVSWGIICGDPRFPAVYTNVAKLRSFITLNTDVI